MWDMLQAVTALQDYTRNRSLKDYLADSMLRDAVERRFEILGEALVRLRQSDPDTAGRIGDQERIVGFRNVIAHEYDRIAPGQVWRTVQEDLPPLRQVLERLLDEPEDPAS